MIDAILAKVFGTKNKREIKAIQPIIAAINDLEPAIQQLSDIVLTAKTIIAYNLSPSSKAKRMPDWQSDPGSSAHSTALSPASPVP